MPILYVVGIAISLPLIVHCIKTGRNRGWIWLLLSLPLVGSAVYFCVEVLPDLGNSRAGRRAVRGLRDTLNPEGDLRRAENAVKISGNVASRQKYADELVRLGRAAEALPIYQTCLTGIFAEDPKVMLGYANAQFAAGEPAAARATLDELIRKSPDFKSADGHLLYARALEGEGNHEKALSEYAAIAEYFTGAEAGVRYAMLLKQVGQTSQARETLQALLERARYAPAHYRRAQRDWLDQAASELRS